MSNDLQAAVEDFWNARPCGSQASAESPGSLSYFDEIEAQRYRHEPHIAGWIDRLAWSGRDVLEVGAGVATDGRRIAGHGARYVGINVDAGSTELARRNFEVHGVAATLRQGDVTRLDFPDASFDVVYAFGVLMHVPAADRAVSEIFRVLRPGGELRAMVYNRASINYQIEIRILRRLLRRALLMPGVVPAASALGLPREKLQRHAELARTRRDMSDAEWLSRNTDGPDNPYTRVYGAAELQALLVRFERVTQEVAFFDPRHYGALSRLMPSALVRALGRRWGWHRLVIARKAGA
jgi:SAM-dependent methyltransferase